MSSAGKCKSPFRVLAIYPSIRGFGFAIIEPEGTLVHWGSKSTRQDKNGRALIQVGRLIARYQPNGLALECLATLDRRRSTRIRNLISELNGLALNLKIGVKHISRREIIEKLVEDGSGNKYSVAVAVADRFPEELGHSLPPRRRAWMREDHRMPVFEAVALALAF